MGEKILRHKRMHQNQRMHVFSLSEIQNEKSTTRGLNRTDYTQERKEKNTPRSKRHPSMYRTERERETDAKRGKHQTVTFKSHQRSIFHGIFSRQFYS